MKIKIVRYKKAELLTARLNLLNGYVLYLLLCIFLCSLIVQNMVLLECFALIFFFLGILFSGLHAYSGLSHGFKGLRSSKMVFEVEAKEVKK